MKLTGASLARRLGVADAAVSQARTRGRLHYVKGTRLFDTCDKRNKAYLSRMTGHRGKQRELPAPAPERAAALVRRLRAEYRLRKEKLRLLLGGVILKRLSDEGMTLFMRALSEELRKIPMHLTEKQATAPGAWIARMVGIALSRAKKNVGLLKAGPGAEQDDLPNEAPWDASEDDLRALLDSAQSRKFDTLTAISKGLLIKGVVHSSNVAKMAGDVSALLLTLSRRCADLLAAKYQTEGLAKARAALRDELRDAVSRLARHAGKRQASKAREVEKHLTSADVRRMADEVATAFKVLVPEAVSSMTVVDWASKYRILSSAVSPMPGPYDWEATPFWKEIALALSEGSDCWKIVVQKGVQLGFSTLMESWLGWIIQCCPGPTMFLSADKSTAEAVGDLRISRMLDSSGLSPFIYSQTGDKSGKKTGRSKSKLEFPGGSLLIQGARNPAKLRSHPVRYLAADELDGWPAQVGEVANREGSPLELAEKRTVAFERVRKVLVGSTPTSAINSRIVEEMEKTNRRMFYIPCPVCGHMQTLRFRDEDGTYRLVFEKDADGHLIEDSVAYLCEAPGCGARWKNTDKARFLSKGEWRATAKSSAPGLRGYFINSLYAPVTMQSWESIARAWIDCAGDQTKTRVFMNQVLGLPYVEKGISVREDLLEARPRDYVAGTLPPYAKPLIMTAGVDVQKRCLHVELIAWGRDRQSWSTEYLVIPAGDVTEDVNDPCWSQLSEVLAQPHAEGFIVNTTLIDSGFQPQTTYAFCERHPWRAYPSRGESNPSDYKLIGVKDLAHVGSKVIGLNTSALKEEVFTMLQKGTADGAPPQEPFPGYCSFPIDYPSSFFSMLCAEERTVVRNKQSGRPHLVWKTKRPGQANHALDARVYAYAALLVTYALRRKEIKDGGSTEDYNWQSFWNEAERMLQESEEGVRK